MDACKWKYDFGTLSNAVALDRRVTNLTELWWDDEKEKLLNLWCSLHESLSADLSDYEKFRALCEMMPSLNGHPVRRHCRDFLRTHFACEMSLDLQNCDAIWRLTSEALLMTPKTCKSLLPADAQLLCSDERSIDCCEAPIFDACRFQSYEATDWGVWKEQADQDLTRFSKHGCNRIFLTLPHGFVFQKPDVYHVELALKKKHKTEEDMCLLLSQTVRYACEACLLRGWSLTVRIADCGDGAVRLFEYVEKRIGLPKILWSTADAKTRDQMLAFGYQTHKNLILPMLCLVDYPSDRELDEVWDAYAARYPIGWLLFACGTDVRNRMSERARLDRILKNKEKRS